MFSSEFCEIFKKIFFTEHLRVTASDVMGTLPLFPIFPFFTGIAFWMITREFKFYQIK